MAFSLTEEPDTQMYKYQSVCSKIHVVACLWAGLKVESWEHLRLCPVGASEPMSVFRKFCLLLFPIHQ